MSTYPYLVRPQEPAVFVELYLPKKALFQGVLYDTLTSGFRLKTVQQHFLDADDERQRKIRGLLGKSWTDVDYTRDDILRFRRVFFGYSLYDVDGVFLKSAQSGPLPPDDSDDDYEIAEETSQVVRMVFKYPCADQSAGSVDFVMRALQRPLARLPEFIAGHAAELDRLPGDEAEQVRRLITDLEQWLKYVGLFVFGFVVYQICERIIDLGATTKSPLDPADLLQDEIWVTSYWAMSMNVVEWVSRPIRSQPLGRDADRE